MERDDLMWHVEFSVAQNEDASEKYSVMIQLPLWALVNMYGLYEGLCPGLVGHRQAAVVISPSTPSNKTFFMSDLRKERRKLNIWNRCTLSCLSSR